MTLIEVYRSQKNEEFFLYTTYNKHTAAYNYEPNSTLHDHPALKFLFSNNGLNKAAYFMIKEKLPTIIN